MSKRKKIKINTENDTDNSKNEITGENIHMNDKQEEKIEEKIMEQFEEKQAEDTISATEDENLKKELEEAKSSALQYRESYLRARADYENLKKRSEQQISISVTNGKRFVIGNLLEVLDNFERALNVDENKVSAKDILIGVRMIHKQLKGLLEDEGLKEIGTVGNIFDPKFHEAVESVVSNEHKDEEIIGEFIKGYTFKNEVIRPARVKVARQPAEG